MSLVNNILGQENPYKMDLAIKKIDFLKELKKLMNFHYNNSSEFRNFVSNSNYNLDVNHINELPFIPARLFKLMNLRSIPDENVFKIMTSSGTSGQAVSRIYLDKESSLIQTKVLSHIISSFLGKKRRNMMIIDSQSIIKDRKKFNARAAGILGFSSFGKHHKYLLDDNLNLDISEFKIALEQNKNNPLLIFGFTYLVWQQFYQGIQDSKIDINFPEDTVLIHGGGWKRLHDSKVDNARFKKSLNELGILKVYDYYGMIEQTGSIFVECEEGYLHCSDYSDIIARDEHTLDALKFNEQGILQVLSLLPSSYPGNSILTEDIGTIIGEDDCQCGKKGKYFLVSGRMKQSEVRGCSDTRAV
jgi:phenylacetate-coenzyme A ligase PaaK-like adenylate-forming protein